jgi:hypothetical protein
VSDEARTLGEIALVVRSKNAGPFWFTLDVFFRSDADFAHVRDARVLTDKRIGDLYGVDPALVKRFELPEIRAMKFSMPRAVVAGSFEDRDLHAGQQHVPLALLTIPGRKASSGMVGQGED